MRKLISTIHIFILLVLSVQVEAQRNAPNLPHYDMQRFHFGINLGINYATFTIKPQSNLNPFDSLMVIQPGGMAGFDIGLISNMNIGTYFDLRFLPAISLIDRKLNYQIKYQGNTLNTLTQNIESVNLNFPLLLKLKSSRMGNVRFYVVSGGQYTVDLASRSKKRNTANNTYIKLYASDFQAQVGTGLDFYLEFFKFSIEAKISFGTLNLIKKENNMMTNSIQYLHSKTFHISFLFEG